MTSLGSSTTSPTSAPERSTSARHPRRRLKRRLRAPAGEQGIRGLQRAGTIALEKNGLPSRGRRNWQRLAAVARDREKEQCVAPLFNGHRRIAEREALAGCGTGGGHELARGNLHGADTLRIRCGRPVGAGGTVVPPEATLVGRALGIASKVLAIAMTSRSNSGERRLS